MVIIKAINNQLPVRVELINEITSEKGMQYICMYIYIVGVSSCWALFNAPKFCRD